MINLDTKDRDILAVLAREARLPLKTLAGRIGLSRSATGERVARLEKAGIIRGYRADIGSTDQKLVYAFLLVTLKRTPACSVLDAFAAMPDIRRVSSVGGQIDLVIEAAAPSIDRLNCLRDAIAMLDGVEDLTTSIVLRHEIERD